MRSWCAESILFLVLGFACTSASIAQSTDPLEEFKACAKIADRDTRFACFDNLGERVLQEESAVEKPTPEIVAEPEAAATATDAASLPDDLGGSSFGESKDNQHTGLITSCQESHDGRLFFFFDNGQVWKQVRYDKLRLKECNFSVTIMQDAFGYKMQIDGEEKRIRISRKR